MTSSNSKINTQKRKLHRTIYLPTKIALYIYYYGHARYDSLRNNSIKDNETPKGSRPNKK